MQMDFAAWPDDRNAACMAAAAAERGLATAQVKASPSPDRAPQAHLQLSAGGKHYLYARGRLFHCDPARRLAANVNHAVVPLTIRKSRTKELLRQAGAATPDGRLFAGQDGDAALEFFRSLGSPACLKPDTGERGRGIRVGLSSPQEFASAFSELADRHPALLVEAQVAGEAVRFFYVAPEIVGIRIDRPASVVGDGRTSIVDLLAAKNVERAAHLAHPPIEIDASMHAHLRRAGRTLGDVPSAGERVFLKGTSNIPTGGEAIECRDRLHPSHWEAVEALCRSVAGLRLAAIDTVIPDPETPAGPGNHWVLEINSAPGVVPFYFPWEGRPQDVCGRLLERLEGGGW